jgi:hypothetical protein
MTDTASSARSFDLQPDPRILMMLGEIALPEWACLAELIDNSVDGFIEAVRAGRPTQRPQVSIQIPTSAAQYARVEVRDNGPGMDAATLERAARAGWSSHGPTDNLGLFGMGFNIATARLGQVTEVFSTRSGDPTWVGIRIDFRELVRQGHFRTPQLTLVKPDPNESGTRVVISELKPDKLTWLSLASNRAKLKKRLARVYSAMLQANGHPLSFDLSIGNTKVTARRHCVWNDTRDVPHTRLGRIPAVIPIDHDLGARPFCSRCWQWLSDTATCPQCNTAESVRNRERRIRGWLGIQTYCDREEFGIDFLRHGRKIEIGNKELFTWEHDDEKELEYPIDDLRLGGRIVGEIHLDHCSVPYTKDFFSRTDPSWSDMIRAIRGDGPLRPQRATELGLGQNDSPLARLYQGYRRATPHNKVAGVYERLLAVKNNEAARSLAEKFYAGEPGLETDDRWWKLIEEADRDLLASTSQSQGGTPTEGGTSGPIPGFAGPAVGGTVTSAPGAPQPVAPTLPRRNIASLSQVYIEDMTSQRYEVRALACDSRDADLQSPQQGWRLLRRTEGFWEFLHDPSHRVFRSATFTPLDALLAEISTQSLAYHRETRSPRPATFSGILAGLRSKYAGVYDLDADSMVSAARDLFRRIAVSLSTHSVDNGQSLFEELQPSERELVMNRMAQRGAVAPQAMIASGGFLSMLEPHSIVRLVSMHPELVFDGKCWDIAYASLDYGTAETTSAAQQRVLGDLNSLLADALWLAQQDISVIRQAGHARLIRCLASLDLAAETMNDEGNE